MTKYHTNNDGWVDKGGYSEQITQAEDMGGYTVDVPVRNKPVHINRKTGETKVLEEKVKESPWDPEPFGGPGVD